MDRNFILEHWDDLASMALGGVPTELRGEFKKTFYAGAAAIWKVISTDPALDTFDQVHRELEQYYVALNAMAAVREAAAQQTEKPPMDADKMRMIEHMARDAFNTLDESIGGALNRRELGAALFLFSFIGQELTYVSNAERPDMIKMLHEFLAANPPAMTWDEQHG